MGVGEKQGAGAARGGKHVHARVGEMSDLRAPHDH